MAETSFQRMNLGNSCGFAILEHVPANLVSNPLPIRSGSRALVNVCSIHQFRLIPSTYVLAYNEYPDGKGVRVYVQPAANVPPIIHLKRVLPGYAKFLVPVVRASQLRIQASKLHRKEFRLRGPDMLVIC